MHLSKKLAIYLFVTTFSLYSYTASAEEGIPDWWSFSGVPKETTFSNIDESKVNIKDVATAITILPTDLDQDNIRAAITIFLDKDNGKLYYFLDAQQVTDSPEDLIPTQTEAIPLSLPMPTIDPTPSIPAIYLRDQKVIHASVTAMDEIVVVSYGAQYSSPDGKSFIILEYIYGRIKYPSSCKDCDLKDVTIEWSDQYHQFLQSDPLPFSSSQLCDRWTTSRCVSHYAISGECAEYEYKTHETNINFDSSNMYPTLTAGITKAHNIVLSGTLYQSIYAKSGSITMDNNGEIDDNLSDISTVRVSPLASRGKKDENRRCYKPTGSRSSSIALLTNNSDHRTRGIIVERVRSDDDSTNNLYSHGIRFDFADGDGNALTNNMLFAEPELNNDVVVSKRRLIYDTGISPIIGFMEGASSYNYYGEEIFPLLEIHKAGKTNNLHANIGGMLVEDGGDYQPDTYSITNTGDTHSMSSGKIDGLKLESIAAYEYDTFPGFSVTPYGEILLARACGIHQASVCTEWATSELAPIEVKAPTQLVFEVLSPDSVQIDWAASLSYGIDTYILKRDGIEVGRVDGDTTEYVDHSLTPDTSYNYSIIAQNANGQQSQSYYFQVVTF